MIFRQYIKIEAAGVTNDIKYDSGLTSTPTEKKKLVSICLVVERHFG